MCTTDLLASVNWMLQAKDLSSLWIDLPIWGSVDWRPSSTSFSIYTLPLLTVWQVGTIFLSCDMLSAELMVALMGLIFLQELFLINGSAL